jgi:hypothetical protein
MAGRAVAQSYAASIAAVIELWDGAPPERP